MTKRDAQFIESRSFQVEEVSRIYGVPPHLLGQTEKQTSWGTGVAEQNLGLSRYTLMGYTSRIESALVAVLAPAEFAEFDYKGSWPARQRRRSSSLLDTGRTAGPADDRRGPGRS